MYTFPSLKKAAKLPQIILDGDNAVQKYRDWLADSGIFPTVPPLHQDFVLRYTCSFNGRSHDYADIVHYVEDLTAFVCCHSIDGKKVMEVSCDYAEQNTPGELSCSGFYPPTTPYTETWLRNEGCAVATAVVSVQAFILYHRPDVIPEELPAPKPRKAVSSHAKPSRRTTTVKDVRHHIIRLDPVDTIPVAKNYRAIQWRVRGHYRRIKGADGQQRLVYVRPHTAQRGKKKISPPDIIIKEANHDR